MKGKVEVGVEAREEEVDCDRAERNEFVGWREKEVDDTSSGTQSVNSTLMGLMRLEHTL